MLFYRLCYDKIIRFKGVFFYGSKLLILEYNFQMTNYCHWPKSIKLY